MCVSAPRAASRAALDEYRRRRDELQEILEILVEHLDVPDHLVDWGHAALVQSYIARLT